MPRSRALSLRSIVLGLTAVLAATPLAAARPGEAPPALVDSLPADVRGPFDRAEQSLADRAWEAALAPLQEVIATELRNDRRPSGALAPALARLAVAEAGLGRLDDARRHWQMAQNLVDGAVDVDLPAYGAAGELLAASPLRRPGTAPAGLDVHALHSSPGLAAPRRLQGGDLDLRPLQAGEPPLWMRVELVVDADGAVREPVVLASNSPRLTFEVLDAVRGWRYEPARLEGRPVAAFLVVEINPPADRPFLAVTPLAGELAEIEKLLRAGRWKTGGWRAEKLWTRALHNEQTPQAFARLFTLRALAEAGRGGDDLAICFWQAAQGLEPALFHASLADYGAPGALLAAHRWRQAERKPLDPALQQGRRAEAPVERPEILRRTQPQYPPVGRAQWAEGTLIVDSVIATDGSVRLPFHRPISPGERASFTATTLDALCHWKFKPATFGGKAVPVAYSLTINYAIEPD